MVRGFPLDTEPSLQAPYQEIIETIDESSRSTGWQFKTPVGAWVPVVKAELRRVKRGEEAWRDQTIHRIARAFSVNCG